MLLKAAATALVALAGGLDPTWGTRGTVTIPLTFYDSDHYVYADEVGYDRGRILVSARFGHLDARTLERRLYAFTPRGRLDRTFANGGVLSGETLALVLRDGRLLTTARARIIRRTRDGSLDRGFGVRGTAMLRIGKCEYFPFALAEQRDGAVVALVSSCADVRSDRDSSDIKLLRLQRNGTLDRSFGRGGLAVARLPGPAFLGAAGLALDSDGKAVVATDLRAREGITWAVVRFDARGGVDATFGTRGVLVLDVGDESPEPAGMFSTRDGVVFYGCDTRGAEGATVVRRVRGAGLDTTWGDAGVVRVAVGTSSAGADCGAAAPRPEGGVVVSGRDRRGARLAFVDERGELDEHVAPGGTLAVDAWGTPVVQPDDRVVVAGAVRVAQPKRRWALAVSRVAP